MYFISKIKDQIIVFSKEKIIKCNSDLKYLGSNDFKTRPGWSQYEISNFKSKLFYVDYYDLNTEKKLKTFKIH